MKKVIYLLLLNLLTNGLFAQSRDTTWKNFREVDSPYFHLLVPANWLDIGSVGDVVVNCFDVTGMYFPDSFNTAPIIVGFFVINQPASNLEEAKQSCINGYKTNPDRVFPENLSEGQQKIKLSSGQDAYLLNTRFFRKTKNLNQSRFDLVVYSEKAKQGYLVTVSVQYNDPTYMFENKFHLADFANKTYSYFVLK